MKHKYVEERFPRWFVFGDRGDVCDVADANGDVFRGIPKATAEKLIAAREAYVGAITVAIGEDYETLSAYVGPWSATASAKEQVR